MGKLLLIQNNFSSEAAVIAHTNLDWWSIFYNAGVTRFFFSNACILLLENQWQTVTALEPEPIQLNILKESWSCYNQNNTQTLARSYTSFYCCISDLLNDFSGLRYLTAKLW